MPCSWISSALSRGCRFAPLVRRQCSSITYAEYGQPSQVVRLTEQQGAKLGEDHVQVEMLMAPINPADLNTIQGKYPITPPLPAIGGGEGVGKVIAVGQDVPTEAMSIGDLVLPTRNMAGTWTTRMQGTVHDFHVVPSTLPLPFLATLKVNPCTAYRMLADFEELKKGDVVVQNGANSHVGQSVIQLSKAMGYRTVNIVRNRNNIDELKAELTNLGADYVFTEEEIRKRDVNPFRNGQLPAARLALNCVGGDSSTAIIQCLGKHGTHVTYGGMSLNPVVGPTSALIFKDIKIRGFWMSRWTEEYQGTSQQKAMFQAICDLAANGRFVAPKHRLMTLENYAQAIEEAMEGFKDGKYIFDMRK